MNDIFERRATELIAELPLEPEPYDPEKEGDHQRFCEEVEIWRSDTVKTIAGFDESDDVFEAAREMTAEPLANELFRFRAHFGVDYLLIAGDIVDHIQNRGEMPSGMDRYDILHWQDAAVAFCYYAS